MTRFMIFQIVVTFATIRSYIPRETTQTGSLSDVTVTLLAVLRTRFGASITIKALGGATSNKWIKKYIMIHMYLIYGLKILFKDI